MSAGPGRTWLASSRRSDAVAGGAQDAPGYQFLYRAIRLGCRTAIAISQKV
ncbi:hypothetical protein [Novosphingobium sp. BL-52-GroH]|uniref:hypothetical protein n=1 Tax=Novosphingobium sp. BL-52-GroH TaxID=3349877 RepID=UPI00385152EA